MDGEVLARLLLGVFALHLPFFAWRAWRTRELRYAATTLVFVLLVAAYGLRVFAPELHMHEALRVGAWILAVPSLGLLIRHRMRSSRR